MKTKQMTKIMMLMTALAVLTTAAYAQTTATTLPSSVTATNIVLDYDQTSVEGNPGPGDTGVLKITIKNIGYFDADNVELFVGETSDIKVSRRWTLGSVFSGTSKSVSTTVAISKNAQSGVKAIPVTIRYDGYDIKGKREYDKESSYEVPIRIKGNANFQFEASKGTFYQDTPGKVLISGTAANGVKDASATLSSKCASVIGGDKIYLGNVRKDEEIMLEYAIQPSSVGICSLDLLMEYSDASGGSLEETLSVGINTERYNVDFKIIDVAYTGATPGSTANITLNIENVGTATANDVSISLGVLDPLVAVGSAERFLGNVKSKEKTDVSFAVSIDSSADIKSYDVPVTITYFDLAGNKQTVSKAVGIKVDGKPEIKVIIQKIDLLTSGTKAKVTLDVVNKGFAQVKFLNLKVLPTEQYDVTSAEEVYIGNLDSDSTDSQDFEVQVKNNVAPGKIPLKIEVSYKEKNNNEDHVEPINLEMNVLSMQDYASKQPAGSPIMMVVSIVGGLLALVVGLIVLWFVIKVFFAVIGFLDRKLFKRK